MSKKIIYFIEIIIIIIGRVLNTNSTKQVFYRNIFIILIWLMLTYIMSKSFLKLYLKDKRNFGNNTSFTTLIVAIVFALIIGSSLFSLINNSIIFLVNKESETECVKIVNKEISRIHGISYYYELDNIVGHQDVKIKVPKKTYNNFREGQYIEIKYYSVGNLIKYVNRDEVFISCLNSPSSRTNNP